MTEKWDPSRRELLTEASGVVLAGGVVFGIPIGAFRYRDYQRPAGETVIELTGKSPQWGPGYWDPEEIVVTKGQEVVLVLNAEDVVHSFDLPGYNISEELYPGEPQTVSFVAGHAGEFEFYCNVYCGFEHVTMTGTLIVEDHP